MIDLDALEALAKAAMRCEWGHSADRIQTCGDCGEGEFIAAASPDAILSLIAEVRALREDKARLDSGAIMTVERDEFGEEYRCERRGNDLRAMIDAARRDKS